MDIIEAAGMCCCSEIETDPLIVIQEQMRGIHEDIADLLLYCQQELEKKNVQNG